MSDGLVKFLQFCFRSFSFAWLASLVFAAKKLLHCLNFDLIHLLNRHRMSCPMKNHHYLPKMMRMRRIMMQTRILYHWLTPEIHLQTTHCCCSHSFPPHPLLHPRHFHPRLQRSRHLASPTSETVRQHGRYIVIRRWLEDTILRFFPWLHSLGVL